MKDEIRMKVWADAHLHAATKNYKDPINFANQTLAYFDKKWGSTQPEPPQEDKPDQPPLKVGDELKGKGIDLYRIRITNCSHPMYSFKDSLDDEYQKDIDYINRNFTRL